MKENEEHLKTVQEQKQRIRDRYKGVDADELEVIPAIPQEDFYDEKRRKRVAVYARVSTDDPRQTSSYELQKNHYTDMVHHRPDWDLIDIYADEGISGTSLQHRDSFIRMIEDCKAGKIDLIVTKSVSRFARNVLDCIGYVRQLKAMNPPIGIFFETENIFTLNPNSEMSLSFIATLAQEESHNKSEIMNSSIEMRFKRGIFLTPKLLGYDQDENGNLVINEEEAKIVRLIFFLYLYGYSTQRIADLLTKLGCQTKRGNVQWSPNSILQILQNERHCGDVIARKTFTPNYLDHKSKKNNNERNKYRMKNHHENIVSRDDYIAVQHLISNSKYGKQEFLPSIQVMNEGILKGFILINTKWAGFKPEDYIGACQTTKNRFLEKRKSAPSSPAKGEFDLRGFEIARVQFINTFKSVNVMISNKCASFSSESVSRFPEDQYVQFFLQPVEKIFAVKPCRREDPYSVQWSVLKEGKPKNKKISNSAFLPTLYRIMDWNPEYRYKCMGNLKELNSQKVIIFNLSDVEIIMPRESVEESSENVASITGGKRNVIGFPAEWSESFGSSVYEHPHSGVSVLLAVENSIIGTRSLTIEDSELNVTCKEEVGKEIKDLIAHFKEGNTKDNAGIQ